MSKQKTRTALAEEAEHVIEEASSDRPGPEEPFQATVEKAMERKEERPRKLLTAGEAVAKVLARPDKPHYHHAGHTEFEAVELLVKAGWEREKAEREVRTILYSGPGPVG